MLDLLIRDAKVVDGTGNPGYTAHVGVKEGKIALISRSDDLPEAARTIEARGLVLAPGFVDMHTHTEYTILCHNHGITSLKAGVTTEVMGMCGYSIFPVNETIRQEAHARMAGLSQVSQSEVGEIDWRDLAGWLDKVEHVGTGINVLQYAGHGGIRAYVMGKEGEGGEKVIPAKEQLDKMKDVVLQCMEQGAFGLSSGLNYAPGRNAITEELIELGKVVSSFGGSYISHIRSEDEHLAWSCSELIDICRHTGMRGSVTHHKAFGKENWGKVHHTTYLIDQAREDGVDVMCDFYPWEYAAESNIGTSFYTDFELSRRDSAELRGWLTDEASWQSLKTRLKQTGAKEALATTERSRQLAAHGVLASAGGRRQDSTFIVHAPAYPELCGLSIREATRGLGFADDTLEACRKLYLDNDGYCYVAGGKIWEQDLRHLVRYSRSAISTDSWTMERAPDLARPGMSSHPRAYGSFARVLGQYSRDESLITLEDAVRKMTSLPASFIGLRKRGLIQEGYWADITLFNPENVANLATFDNPFVYPAGINYVIVNGEVAVDDGRPQYTKSGKVLRFER